MEIKDILEKVKSRYDKEKAGDFKGSFSFEIEGGDPKEFTLSIKNDGLEITEKIEDSADCIIKTDLDTFSDIVNGEKSPISEYMKGKLKIKGDLGSALKLNELFFS
ncbi:MAG: SCP2 sterol-binding domain-containing protein [Kosmotoga sp.]|nr:MAG: SCP2 sterol-binding domain-containing protein [Kosmotoga sp.]